MGATPKIAEIGKLATTAKETAQSLSQTLGIGKNGTQPVPLGGPSQASLEGVAAASLFAVGAGGTELNQSVLNELRANLAGGLTSLQGAGAIGGPFSYEGVSAAASAALGGLENNTLSSSSFDSQGLSDVANTAFAVGADDLNLPGLEGVGALGDYVMSPSETGAVPKDWIFICAPESVKWEKRGEHATVNTYGSNNPYVVYSSTEMRRLQLSDILVEGFSAGKEVEGHLEKLENMMRMVMNTEKGYVSPYVWDLRAGAKSYGKFILVDLNVDEVMRNASGRADRARVSMTLQQVPDFQISDGRDLATSADLAGGQSLASEKDPIAASKTATPGTKVTPPATPGNPTPPPPAPAPKPDEQPTPEPAPVPSSVFTRPIRRLQPAVGPTGLTIQPPGNL